MKNWISLRVAALAAVGAAALAISGCANDDHHHHHRHSSHSGYSGGPAVGDPHPGPGSPSRHSHY